MELATAVCSGFALAMLAPWLTRRLGRLSGAALALLPGGLTWYFAGLIAHTAAGQPLRESHAWAPRLGVALSFQADGLALLFALLISGIGTLILLYAGGYMAGHKQQGRLHCFLLLFMASMLGVVLADNLLALFVFWELTSFSSYLLIGFNHERAESRAAALQALLVTGGGGLALLAGLLLMGDVGGSFELSQLKDRATAIREGALYLPILGLVLLGAATKSAQFPFHFWLPGAMAAPTPVSAYLHSATMVKAGVYLLARMSPILGGTPPWQWSVAGLGAATLLVGAYLALTRTDLKLLLAYSTVSSLGLLTMLLGIGTPEAVIACTAFLLAHALYKGALFMLAGSIDHETGTRDALRLGGLWWAMPVTFAVALVAGLSMAGVGPLLSFIAKELVFETLWHDEFTRRWLVALVVLASGSFVAVAGIVALKPFLGAPRETPKPPHEAPPDMWLGPLALAALGVAAGIWPDLAAQWILAPAAAAVVGEPVQVKLALWHGFNTALALSAASLLLGVALYFAWPLVRRLHAALAPLVEHGPQWWYEVGLQGLNGLAKGQTRLLQNGYLRFYLLTVLLATAGLIGGAVAMWPLVEQVPDWRELAFYEAAMALLIVLAATAAAVSRSRFAAIAALGVVGYSVAVLFVMFGAPDLAMTQFLVETLIVIVFVLAFYHLPSFAELSSAAARLRDVAISLVFGALMSLLVLATVSNRFFPSISDFYLENSLPAAYGRNVVNVILVDFRGLDTLGEISVLAVAGVGVYALLKLRPTEDET